MAKSYGELAKTAERAVTGIKDKELRKEAFKILLLQLISGRGGAFSSAAPKAARKAAKKKTVKRKVAKKKAAKITKKKGAKRPGRAGGGVVTTILDKLVAAGYFKKQRDAATIYKQFTKRRANILPSQLRMELLRFARNRKLKRKIKMKGKKVTYLYSK